MTDFDQELDIEIRDQDDVGCRIILLAALSIWRDCDIHERAAWLRWLRSEGVMDIATRTETDVLESPVGNVLRASDADLCERSADSITVLSWATALSDSSGLSLDDTTPRTLADGIPMAGERIEPFLDQLVLRDEDLIALERERAELWNWRLASEAILRTSAGRERNEVGEAIREVVLESAISFAVDEIDTEDFLVDGVPVRKLGDAVLESLIVTSEERLRAFNWLCGLTEWASVHPLE